MSDDRDWMLPRVAQPTDPDDSESTRRAKELVSDQAKEELRAHMVRNGFGDLIRFDQAYREVDTDELRRAAHRTYGTPDDLNTQGIAETDPSVDNWPYAPIGGELWNLGDRAYITMVERVRQHWQGPAFKEFNDYHLRLREVTILEGRRHAEIGRALSRIADVIDQTKAASEMTFSGAVGWMLTVAGAGRATAPKAIFDIILAVASNLNNLQAEAERATDVERAWIEGLNGATIDLNSPTVVGSTPTELMPEFPDDPDDMRDWRVN